MVLIIIVEIIPNALLHVTNTPSQMQRHQVRHPNIEIRQRRSRSRSRSTPIETPSMPNIGLCCLCCFAARQFLSQIYALFCSGLDPLQDILVVLKNNQNMPGVILFPLVKAWGKHVLCGSTFWSSASQRILLFLQHV